MQKRSVKVTAKKTVKGVKMKMQLKTIPPRTKRRPEIKKTIVKKKPVLKQKLKEVVKKKLEVLKKAAAKTVPIKPIKTPIKGEIKKKPVVKKPKPEIKTDAQKRKKSPVKSESPSKATPKEKKVETKPQPKVAEKKKPPKQAKPKPKPAPKIKVVAKKIPTVIPKKPPTKPKPPPAKPIKVKEEPITSDTSSPASPSPPQPEIKEEPAPKKPAPKKPKSTARTKQEQRNRKMKLFTMWNGPKRHRVASLNATAKVHCLYENESRSNIYDSIDIKKEYYSKQASRVIDSSSDSSSPSSPPNTRTLRSVPGLRAAGKMWDMHTSSSESEIEDVPSPPPRPKPKPKPPADPPKPKPKVAPSEKKPYKKRKRAEIIMDLKDMVVRKRMASLNATAILAASYCVEKRGDRNAKSTDSDTTSDSDDNYSSEEDVKKKCFEDDVKKEDERKVIEVRATPNNKVAVILNKDTDVTITGVYVNSTTRSTHHEGYCSIAGMQYRISATSHTQTAATAVATETILQSASTSSQESSNGDSTPTKSYTPLDALSNMQPPAGSSGGSHAGVPMGHHHMAPPPGHILSPVHGELSPVPRRHGCSSAFSAPPGQCGPQGHHHIPVDHGCVSG